MEEIARFITNITSSNIFLRIVICIIGIAIVWIINRLMERFVQSVLDRENTPISQSSIVVNIVRIIVWGIGLCFIADTCFDVNMSAVIAALGVGGIAVSLGFQKTLTNLFGGLQITTMHVVKPGDNIVVTTYYKGVVQDVNWCYTILKDSNDNLVYVPNSVISGNPVTHLPPPDWIIVPLTVTSLNDLDGLAEKIKKVSHKIALDYANIKVEPTVTFDQVTEYGVSGNIKLQIDDAQHATDVSDAIARAVAPLVQGIDVHVEEVSSAIVKAVAPYVSPSQQLAGRQSEIVQDKTTDASDVQGVADKTKVMPQNVQGAAGKPQDETENEKPDE